MIFSSYLKEHIEYLTQIFDALTKINIYLFLKKLFLNYSFIYLLGQRVNTLRLTTAENKLTIIINLIFSKTLSQLKKYLDIIDYLR